MNKNDLYNKIINKVAYEVKHALNESVVYDNAEFSERLRNNEELCEKLYTVFCKHRVVKVFKTNGNTIYFDINEQTKEIIVKNVTFLYLNIETGLYRWNSIGIDYTLLFDKGCEIEISDSYSSSMNIKSFLGTYFNIFSTNNEFGRFTLKYISVEEFDLGNDFLKYVYADELKFARCKGFPTMLIDKDAFKNKNINLTIYGAGKFYERPKVKSDKPRKKRWETLYEKQKALLTQVRQKLYINDNNTFYFVKPGSIYRIQDKLLSCGFRSKNGWPAEYPIDSESYYKVYNQALKTGFWYCKEPIVVTFIDNHKAMAITGDTATRWTLEDAIPGSASFHEIDLD